MASTRPLLSTWAHHKSINKGGESIIYRHTFRTLPLGDRAGTKSTIGARESDPARGGINSGCLGLDRHSLRLIVEPATERNPRIMKVFLAICVLISLGLASADYRLRNRSDMLTYREECVKELAVPADLVEKYQKWEYPNDSTTQCYIKCVFTKWELFDKTTGFNVENIHQQLVGHGADHNVAFHGKLAGCVDNNEQGSNACEWAYRGATCLLRENLAQIQKSLAPKA